MTDASPEMRSAPTGLVELLRSGRYATDKAVGYLVAYEALFRELRDAEICLLELGVREGGSLKLWRDYFPRATIVGLDLELPNLPPADSARIRMFEAAQDDALMLGQIRRETAPGGFDIVIDDCSHLGWTSSESFKILFFEHLRPGGIYAIEDWGTGYWSWWPDGSSSRPFRLSAPARLIGRVPRLRFAADRFLGANQLRSHQAGMVGFVKQLIDECARPDRERTSASSSTGPNSPIEEISVRPGLVIVRKGPAVEG